MNLTQNSSGSRQDLIDSLNNLPPELLQKLARMLGVDPEMIKEIFPDIITMINQKKRAKDELKELEASEKDGNSPECFESRLDQKSQDNLESHKGNLLGSSQDFNELVESSLCGTSVPGQDGPNGKSSEFTQLMPLDETELCRMISQSSSGFGQTLRHSLDPSGSQNNARALQVKFAGILGTDRQLILGKVWFDRLLNPLRAEVLFGSIDDNTIRSLLGNISFNNSNNTSFESMLALMNRGDVLPLALSNAIRQWAGKVRSKGAHGPNLKSPECLKPACLTNSRMLASIIVRFGMWTNILCFRIQSSINFATGLIRRRSSFRCWVQLDPSHSLSIRS